MVHPLELKKNNMEEVKTSEGFLVLKVSNQELAKATDQEYCVCDHCLASPKEGYYVAVLNSWLCPLCYANWKKHATRYSEDIPVEERNYQFYKNLISEGLMKSL
jgi:hypothetical protein